MNYSSAFSYVFEDKDWLSKILIAGLIALIPIVGWIYITGWMIEIIRRVNAGRTDILPATHFQEFLSLGFKCVIVCLVYSIPVIILSSFSLFFGHLLENTSSDFLTVFSASASCLFGLINFVVAIVISLVCFPAMIRLAETDSISESLKFGEIFTITKNNIKLFLMLFLIDIVASIIACLGMVVCFVGVIFTLPYAMAIVGHVTGQAWRQIGDTEIAAGTNHSKTVKNAAKPSKLADVIEAPTKTAQENKPETPAEQPSGSGAAPSTDETPSTEMPNEDKPENNDQIPPAE